MLGQHNNKKLQKHITQACAHFYPCNFNFIVSCIEFYSSYNFCLPCNLPSKGQALAELLLLNICKALRIIGAVSDVMTYG